MRFVIAFTILFYLYHNAVAQVPFVVVDSVEISGNKHTKDYIIKNEIDISKGDTILFTQLQNVFNSNKNRLLSTGLFVNAIFNLKKYNSATSRATISVKLIESWFIYPYLYFELTDRNFNDWYYDHNADLNRINIALELKHKNISGNNDQLKFKIQRGISKKFELQYIRPFLNKSHRIGFTFNTMYKYSKEIAYKTSGNKLVYYRNEDKNMFRQLRLSSGLVFRPKFFATHRFEFNFYNNSIDSLIQDKYNNNFFYKSPEQRYFELKYSYIFDKREFRIYPKSGYFVGLSAIKTGIGLFKSLNILDVYILAEKYFPIYNRFISSYKIRAKARLWDTKSGYFNNKSLGYEDNYLNGYELYVIDGEDYFCIKSAQRFKLFSGTFNMKKYTKIRQFQLIPYEFYIAFNFDLGYVNNNSNFVTNNFTNRILYGYGPGLDMIIYNNYFQINYSINHTGEGGIFFHYKTEIF